ADEPGVDDLRRGAGDRARRRWLAAGLGPLAADLLVPGRILGAAAVGDLALAARDAAAAGAPGAVAATAAARLRLDRDEPAVRAPGTGRRAQLRRTVPVHRLRACLRARPAAPGRAPVRLVLHPDDQRNDAGGLRFRARGGPHQE